MPFFDSFDNIQAPMAYLIKSERICNIVVSGEKNMATTSFKRKKYGMVKEVKQRKVKLKKPDIRELAKYYRAVAKYGVWQQLDNMCYAMNWWEGAVAWFSSNTPPGELTTAQARKIQLAMQFRREGLAAKSDKQK